MYFCVAAAVMESLGQDEWTTASFHAVCGLSMAVCVLREVMRLLR